MGFFWDHTLSPVCSRNTWIWTTAAHNVSNSLQLPTLSTYTCTTSKLGHSATFEPNRRILNSEVSTAHVRLLPTISNRSQCRSTFDAAYGPGRRHQFHRHGDPAAYWSRSFALVASKISRCSMTQSRRLCLRSTTRLLLRPTTVHCYGPTHK